jgi:hypothetical protein
MKTKPDIDIDIAIHKTGYVITERKHHFKRTNYKGEVTDLYDGDARYVVWNVESAEKPKVFVVASYLPTLIKWLDNQYDKGSIRYRNSINHTYLNDCESRVSLAEKNIKIINNRSK